MLQCNSDGFSIFILKEVRSSDSSGPNSTPDSKFLSWRGCWWNLWGYASAQYRMFCLLTMPCKWKFASSLIRRLFSKSGFSVNIPWKWQQNCKCTSLSRSLKDCTICGLYGWRFRSLCRMCRTLLSYMPHAWECLLADCLRLWLTDANIQCSRVCELRTADQVAFYTWQSLLHATALPIDGLLLEMGLHFNSFHGEICAKSLWWTLSI